MQSKSTMKAFVRQLLTEELSANYFYHNLAHTVYVADQAKLIGNAERCDIKEMKLLEAAALWHDAGFIHTYAKHEEASCELVKEYLPTYDFSAEEVESICGMIMATQLPQTPTNKLEQIIADADLEYLGTANAAAIANNLFMELQSFNSMLTLQQWNQTQILFLEQHHYFTSYCKENKEPTKLAYLEKLKKEIE
jgi:uncharacterized protein